MAFKSHKEQQFCIFCGKPGVTKEHVWPKMWRKFLPAGTNLRKGYTESIVWSRESKAWTPTYADQILRTGSTIHYVVRKICGICNSGWIRQLQERITPEINLISDGTYYELNQLNIGDIALWASVFACAVDTDGDLDTQIHNDDRSYIYHARKAPSHWTIILGRREGSGRWASPCVERKSVGYGDRRNNKEFHLQQTTMSVGHGIFSVFSQFANEPHFKVRPEIFTKKGLLILAPRDETPVFWPSKILFDSECETLSRTLSVFTTRNLPKDEQA